MKWAGYDYGFRNYDPQIGRFPQLDPLTDDYSYLTPYQYASCDPIMNIDLDGLEGFNAIFTGVGTAAVDLGEVVVQSVRHVSKVAGVANTTGNIINVGLALLNGVANISSTLVQQGNVRNQANNITGTSDPLGLGQISLEGSRDALANSLSLGLYDLFSGDRSLKYKDPQQRMAYLRGRLAGDAAAMLMGAQEINGGTAAAAATGAGTMGAGAAVGLGVAAHGAGVIATATKDQVVTLARIYKLSAEVNAGENTDNSTSSNSTTPKKYEIEPPAEKPVKLKNGQGWRDKDGNIWKKDKLHKDHWDVTDPKTDKKIKEIDFDGNQIWPNGPKNKNKT